MNQFNFNIDTFDTVSDIYEESRHPYELILYPYINLIKRFDNDYKILELRNETKEILDSLKLKITMLEQKLHFFEITQKNLYYIVVELIINLELAKKAKVEPSLRFFNIIK